MSLSVVVIEKQGGVMILQRENTDSTAGSGYNFSTDLDIGLIDMR